MYKFDNFVLSVLMKSGWSMERNVEYILPEIYNKLETEGFKIFEEAKKILNSFYKINVYQNEPGISSYRTSFVIDPLVAVGELDIFSFYQFFINKKIYPIGRENHGYDFFFAVSEDGYIYSFMDNSYFIEEGKNFEIAINSWIYGIERKRTTIDPTLFDK